ncbi:MAG: T9SS type A sorting domain-containing protein [Saprospiraceae bacterium]|nr:T9SS type A sorting domain-containing protein [Saprospiraceae bacterium]
MSKKFRLFHLLVAFFLVSTLHAQTITKVLEDIEVEVTYAKKLGTTPQLRHLVPQPTITLEKRAEVKKNKKQIPNFAGRRTHPTVNPNALPQGPDPVWQSEITKNLDNELVPLVNINGMSQANFGGTPPDPCGDIGKDYYIQQINASLIRVHDKEGNVVFGPIATNTIWNSIGFSSSGDPIVLFDQEAERWYITEFPSGNQLLVAISDTSDPMGSWTAYNFATPNFPDYPKYSLWKNALCVTTNEQGPGTLPSYFIDRQGLLDGDANVAIQRIALPGSGGGPGFQVATPVDWTGFTPPPADAQPMILALRDDGWGGVTFDHIEMFSIDLDFDNPSNTVVTSSQIPVSAFDSNPCSSPGPNFGCIPQLGGQGIDGLPEVIMHQVHYRNFITHETMVMNYITDASGSNLSGIRWVEMRRLPGEDWTVFQEGTFAPNDGYHRFMGGIAIDGSGNIGLAYSISSPDIYPGIGFTGRRKNDPLGEMTFDEFVAVQGGSTSPGGRFGDYAQMAIDPYDDRTFWYTGEYRANQGWSTRIISFNLGRDTIDIAPIALISPKTSPFLTDTETVQIEIQNVGIDTQQIYNLGFIFEGDTAVIDSVNFVLPADSTYIHTFSKTVDMSEIRDYEFKIFTALETDQAISNDTLRATVTKLPRFDAGITMIDGLEGLVCGDTLPFDFVLTNFGTDTLKEVIITLELNGTNFADINWGGELPSGQSETFNTEINGVFDGTNIITIYTSLPNGMIDQTFVNDTLSRSFEVITDGVQINLTLVTDNFPDETTWQLTNEAGDIVFSGGPYTASQQTISETWCLDAEECYIFTIFDSYGDGLNNSTGNPNDDGDYQITDGFGNILANLTSSNFGFEESSEFCGTFMCMMDAHIDFSPETSEGATDGALMITALNGVGPYQYSIDGGLTFQDNNFFDGLSAGDYDVVVAGQFDCLFEITTSITLCALEVMATITGESVPDAGDGKIEVEVSAGNPPYQYSLNGNNFTTWPIFSNLGMGDYTITVIDALGCETDVVFTVDVISSSNEQFSDHFIEVMPNPTNGLFRINLKGYNTPDYQLPIQVFDASGKKIQNFQLVKYNETFTGLLSLLSYPNGVYYVRFLDKDLNQMVRVLKQ